MNAPRIYYQDDYVTLWCGRYQDVVPLIGQVDAAIVDAPYSERTHKGHDDGTADANKGTWRRPSDGVRVKVRKRRKISYPPWKPEDVAECCALLSPLVRGWCVSLTDHVLGPHWEAGLELGGRYTFAPLPFVDTGSRVRMTGDGPSAWSCQIYVARPNTPEFARWGTLDGAYIMPAGKRDRDPVSGGAGYEVVGGKPLWLMGRLVCDYTREGDVILDCCAGGGTLGRAAKDAGRRAILIERDEATCAIAAKLLRPHRAWQQNLLDEAEGA